MLKQKKNPTNIHEKLLYEMHVFQIYAEYHKTIVSLCV